MSEINVAADLREAAEFAVEAMVALTAYESDNGCELPENYELGRIDESRGSASFRLRVGHIRRLAAAIAKARGRSCAPKTMSPRPKEPPCSECGQPYIPEVLREPVYKAVERILDEHSAWIARPNDEVTKCIAFAATIAAQKIVEGLIKFDDLATRGPTRSALSDTTGTP